MTTSEIEIIVETTNLNLHTRYIHDDTSSELIFKFSRSGYLLPFTFHHPSYHWNSPETKTVQLSNASITNNNLIFFAIINFQRRTFINVDHIICFAQFSAVRFEENAILYPLHCAVCTHLWTHCNALIKNRHLHLHIGINRDKITPFRLQINQEDRPIHDICTILDGFEQLFYLNVMHIFCSMHHICILL